VQRPSQIITTNKPTSSFFTGRMPFLSPSQECQSTERKISQSVDLLTPSPPGGLPTLSLTINSSCLPWGRVAMPLISPLMPVPHRVKQYYRTLKALNVSNSTLLPVYMGPYRFNTGVLHRKQIRLRHTRTVTGQMLTVRFFNENRIIRHKI